MVPSLPHLQQLCRSPHSAGVPAARLTAREVTLLQQARPRGGTGLIDQGDSASRTVGDIIETCRDVAVLGIGVGTGRQGGCVYQAILRILYSERSHDDADPYARAADPPCVDRCIRSLWMRGSVASRAIMAATAVAALSPTGSNTTPGGEYPPSRTPTHHLGLCPLGPHWQGSSIVIHCDNMGAVAVVNAGSSKVPPIMHLLRCHFFIRAHFTLSAPAVHVPGVENAWADAISCNMLFDFFSQVPGAINRRQPIPPSFLDLLVGQQPDWTFIAWTQLFKCCFPPF